MNHSFASIKGKLKGKLPGESAHQKFSPPMRLVPDENELKKLKPKIAAVMILLFKHEGRLHTLLMERVAYNGVHSQQISFPGGKQEASDTDLSQTALRECHEEAGTLPRNIELLGPLSRLYIPPSNFLVHPYVGIYHTPDIFNKNPDEVSRLITVSLDSLKDESNQSVYDIDVRGKTISCPAFHVQNTIVWGATAMIISELLEVIYSE
jgi:8-oxo-dGTP pyrophosphatase MutT (NUDIX family)